jgi:hypothetical protein
MKCALGAAALALVLPAAARAASLVIQHEAPACVPADRYLGVSAAGVPSEAVAGAELEFRAAPDASWYTIAMRPEADTWRAVLPRPMPELARFEYRIVMSASAGPPAVSAPFTVRVAGDGASCDTPAQGSIDASILVRVPPGAPLVPPVPRGFSPAGVVAEQERVLPPQKRLGRLALAGAAVAGAAVAVAVATGSDDYTPPAPDIPEFVFTGTVPAPGATLSLSQGTLLLFVTMSREPSVPLNIAWRLELRSGGAQAPVCVTMAGLFRGAQRPLSLVLSAPLQSTGACGERFDVEAGRLTMAVSDQTVFDSTMALPFHVEP